VTDFSSTTGMTLTQGTGSVALDSTAAYVRTGTQSLKIVQLASASSALVDLDCRNAALGGTGAEGFSAQADNLWHLRAFVDTPNNQNTVSLFLSNTAAGFTDYRAATVAPAQLSALRTDHWWDRVENRKDWTVGGGSPSWSTPIRTIRIRPAANANGTLTTWLDALYRGGYARPKILLTFDDSNDQQYNRAKPILDSFGLKGTFYCIGDPIQRSASGSLTEAMCDTLYADGHDLAFHAWLNTYNNFTELTADQLQQEIDAWLSYSLAQGWTRARYDLAYPQGTNTATIRSQLSSSGFLSGRTTLRLIQSHVLGLDDSLDVRGWSWDAADGTASPITWMNNAVSYGSTLLIAFHQFHATTSTGAQISDADFTTICKHAYKLQQANLADVVTVSEWRNGLTLGRHPR
jgi:peptidoglycan/xylan/chitin deacetylase (PgdA/CDA1 family)